MIQVKLAVRTVLIVYVGGLLWKVTNAEYVSAVSSDNVSMAIVASISGLMAVIVRYHFKEEIK